jgi:hypothetical protein
LVEHVADHNHAALAPLAHAAQFGMAELGHDALACHERTKQRPDGVCAHAMALGNVLDDLLPFGREFLHDKTGPLLMRRTVGALLGAPLERITLALVHDFRCKARARRSFVLTLVGTE